MARDCSHAYTRAVSRIDLADLYPPEHGTRSGPGEQLLVGPLRNDLTVVEDGNGVGVAHGRESARAMAEYDVAWIEEPVPAENDSGYREVHEKVDTPIAAGEAHVGRFAFKELIDDRTVDIVQPNLGRCGGRSEARLIADMATAENVAVRPHVRNSAVGLAAAVQFAASVSDYPHAQRARTDDDRDGP